MASIEYRHVTRRFPDGTEALVDLDLSVADGELVVLVGPSGCGKSTALRLLAGLDTPTRGELLLDGEPVNALPPARRNLAMVFQNYALYPHMTVRANLAFPLKMAHLPRAEIERRVQHAAALLELTGLLERRPAQLSGGQRQRVAMGRALVREPRAFLLDEPLSNLDAKLRVQIRTEIAALQRRLHATMLYVTHDQVEAMTLGQRVAVLDRGRLQQVAAPQALYDHPANTFVAQFIGSPGMNLFPARLARRGGALVAQCEDLELALPALAAAGAAPIPDAGAPVWVGIRPERLGLAAPRAGAPRASIAAIEVLGHERLVYLDAPWAQGQRLCARAGMQGRLAVGEAVALEMDPQALYLFDDRGRAIGRAGASDD